MAKARGFLPSRQGFPASLEGASQAPGGLSGLTPPPQAFLAFPEPQGSFSVLELHRLLGFCNRQVKKERCTVVKHGSVFTRGTELPRNPQALFRCQCTRSSVPGLSRLSLNIQSLSSFSLPAGSAPSIPVAEARGFTARFDKNIQRTLQVSGWLAQTQLLWYHLP